MTKRFHRLKVTSCARCGRHRDECKGLRDHKMDGLHYWRGDFYCDNCMVTFGEDEIEHGDMWKKSGARKVA